MQDIQNMVIGAGISGLGAWYADKEIEIFEADGCAGGLCGSIDIEGFHFDKAVHLSFSKSELVKELFGKTRHFTHHPYPKSWYHTLWMRHPVQNNLFPLSADEKVKAVMGFLKRNRNLDDSNFKNWNRSRYGEYLWENFFEPYNNKYWDTDLSVLGADWIGNRIYQPTLGEILYGSYTDKTPNTYYAQEMRYPKKGGFYSFIKPIVDEAEKRKKIHYNSRMVRINIEDRIAYFEDGKSFSYNNIYSSVPMPELLRMAEQLPEGLNDIKRFDYTGVAIVSIGLKRSEFEQMWFYIYDSDIAASRAYMPSVKSPGNVPEGCASIQFEIYFNSKKEKPQKQKAINNCIYALEKMKIASEEDVIFTDYRILPFGNVILKDGDERYAESIIRWLESKGLYAIGRFGRWEYLWSDQSFISGYRAVVQRENVENKTN